MVLYILSCCHTYTQFIIRNLWIVKCLSNLEFLHYYFCNSVPIKMFLYGTNIQYFSCLIDHDLWSVWVGAFQGQNIVGKYIVHVYTFQDSNVWEYMVAVWTCLSDNSKLL